MYSLFSCTVYNTPATAPTAKITGPALATKEPNPPTREPTPVAPPATLLAEPRALVATLAPFKVLLKLISLVPSVATVDIPPPNNLSTGPAAIAIAAHLRIFSC